MTNKKHLIELARNFRAATANIQSPSNSDSFKFEVNNAPIQRLINELLVALINIRIKTNTQGSESLPINVDQINQQLVAYHDLKEENNDHAVLYEEMKELENVFSELYKKATLKDKEATELMHQATMYASIGLGLTGLSLTAFFIPAIISAAIAIVLGAIPFVIVLVLSLFLLILGSFADLSGTSPPPPGTSIEMLFQSAIYVGQQTYPIAYAAMPLIAIISAVLAVVAFATSGIYASNAVGIDKDKYFEDTLNKGLDQITKETKLARLSSTHSIFSKKDAPVPIKETSPPHLTPSPMGGLSDA